jgi:hypothetical protein
VTPLFATVGDNLDLGYLNLRSRKHQAEREIAETLDSMWARYEPYADPGFVPAFARDPYARFWEMFLGCAILDAGRALLPASERPAHGGRPDLCIVETNRRIWIEATAPDHGQPGEDQVPQLVTRSKNATLEELPARQVQLRITSALWTKTKIFQSYLRDGVIAGNDVYIVAVGATRFGSYASGTTFPLALSAVFPIGSEFVRFNRDTLEVIGRGFQPSFKIPRAHARHIPRTAFVDPTFSCTSGLLWSRVGIGNINHAKRPLSFIHNPLSDTPMPQRWGVWDREFVATENTDGWTVTDILV